MPGTKTYVSEMAGSSERPDAGVVRDILAGDRDAYRILVRRYGDVMFGHACRMVESSDVAADLVQQSLVQGYAKLASCQDRDRVGAWLFRILANQCRDHLRSPRRRDVPLHVLPDLPGGEDPSEAASRAEAREKVQHALRALTPEQREAFVLKHVEGRSYEEIATVMDLSVASLKMRVHRAREALRGLLEEFA